MKLLKERILRDGMLRKGDILKVDSFLNHQVDPLLLQAIAKEFRHRFSGNRVDKILTIEASGIAVAAALAMELGVPFVFAKKTQSKNLDGEVYTAPVYSYTKDTTYTLMVAKRFLSEGEHVLLIDDFLAMGAALGALLEIIGKANAHCTGAGIVIEKGFQPGGAALRKAGVNVQSLAIVESMQNGILEFREE
ncbi:xanthine phosphoribosyltransferase [Ruminococcaceae bacterium OttesenSCG-928-N02]|nr:xanthine phosphoribosyltransferase [Ruminococcaceae bacterium OttesenSCG-928-N02]